MSDIVKGVAILDDTKGLLFVRYHPEGKPVFTDCLPVYPDGAAKPASIAWKYKVEGDILRVSPSVRVSTTDEQGQPRQLFHNEGEWTVKFRRANVGTPEEGFRLLNEANCPT